MSKPLVSVIMSVYNGRDFIRRSVDSILNQTFRDFEFIIIDDGSNDGGSEILNEYAKSHSCIRIIRHENIGLTKSLIIACNAAENLIFSAAFNIVCKAV